MPVIGSAPPPGDPILPSAVPKAIENVRKSRVSYQAVTSNVCLMTSPVLAHVSLCRLSFEMPSYPSMSMALITTSLSVEGVNVN
ncbi:unnamed protein product [Notodromas monacha]|uniref:Uncharacterized protein n=1 Tax=Notodromas monacha TaxID=399045 RepID=A0A7R9BEW3_9CRUS|nr:unnamed protein product [Notodromas monacha]CAG0914095.1 unnamed protein product [Notodromas monacha]